MTGISSFESRMGKLSCSSEEAFNFVTDIRNFEQFAKKSHISNWQAGRESCSFNVSMLGTVSFRLSEKEKYNKVVFTGDALKKNDFRLTLQISGEGIDPATIKVFLTADLNPVLKMMAAKPVAQFLEMVVNEMESFRGWKDRSVYSQPL